MNTQRDAEEFIRKFQDFSKANPTTLFFSLYKSKIDRINTNAYFKNYNNFNKDDQMGGKQQAPRYKSYNEGLLNSPSKTIN